MYEIAIKKLVNTLNQIEGITIAAIGEEAIAESTLPYITLHCPIDTAADLLEVVIRCQRLQMNILRDDYSPNMAWCILRPAEMPGRFSSLSEIEAELSKELEQSGLLTQNHEGKNVNVV